MESLFNYNKRLQRRFFPASFAKFQEHLLYRTLSANTLPTYVTLTFEKVKNESLEECSILRVKKKKP